MRTRAQLRQEQVGGGTDRESSGDESERDSITEQASGDDAASVRAPPRKRRATTKNSGVRKVAQKKKGCLAVFLNLPVDVFNVIASYLLPGDILMLSRANHFFRNLLMRRSAAPTWKAAERNVEGLPPCPPSLCEPQYAALLFSKHCSGCGTYLARGMDPYFLARLCNICRGERVIDVDQVEESLRELLHKSPLTKVKPYRYSQETCLRSDVDFVTQKLASFSRKNKTTSKGRDKWMESRAKACRARKRIASRLYKYLEGTADNRSKELETLKTQRRNDVIARLENAGWERDDYMFEWSEAREWTALVEAPKPMTDRIWQNLYPKLLPMLEKNHERQIKLGKRIRHRERRRKLRTLLREIRHGQVLLSLEHDTLASTSFVDTISDLGLGDEDGENEGTDTGIQPVPTLSTSILRAPFPVEDEAFELPIICDLLKADTEVDAFVAAFEESRTEIVKVIQKWRSDAESELVEILRGDLSDSSHSTSEDEVGDDESSLSADSPMDDPTLVDKSPGDSEPSTLISPDTRTLLRADSVFCIQSTQGTSPVPIFYPDLFLILQDKALDDEYPDSYFVGQPPGFPWTTNNVANYPEAEVVARALLQEIERPDATAFELEVLGKRFMCGRCRERCPRGWRDMIQHFVEARAHCEAAQSSELPAKDTVVYNTHHSLDPIRLAKGKKKPPVILMDREAAELAASRYSSRLFVTCNLCTELEIDFRCARDGMLRHVKDVHDVKDPKAAHYTRSREKDIPYANYSRELSYESDAGPPFPAMSFEDHLEFDKTAAWWIDYERQWEFPSYL